jgi:hypothetical protein
MTRLWYRHWLELRPAVAVFGIIVAIMVLLYPIYLYSESDFLGRTGRLTHEFVSLGPVIDQIPITTVVPWAIHVTFLSFLVPWLPIACYGSGLGIKDWRAGNQASTTFTLSLPVSSMEVVLTRITAAAAIPTFLISVLLAVSSIWVVSSGRPLPFWLMAMASLRAIVLMAAVVACFSMFAVVLGERIAATLVTVAVLIGSFYAYPQWVTAAKHFVAGANWSSVGIALATAVVCTTVAALIARESEA